MKNKIIIKEIVKIYMGNLNIQIQKQLINWKINFANKLIIYKMYLKF